MRRDPTGKPLRRAARTPARDRHTRLSRGQLEIPPGWKPPRCWGAGLKLGREDATRGWGGAREVR
jgi:hypothetical protein